MRLPPTLCRLLRALPVTSAYAVAVGTTAVVGAVLGEQRSDALALAVSTDLVHLGRTPLLALAGSAFVVERPVHALALPGVVLALGLVERWRGSRAAAGAFAAGHVGATLLVAAGLAAGVAGGLLDPSYREGLDVGFSYGEWALLGLLVARVPVRWRSTYLVVLSAWLVSTAATAFAPVDAGHLTAWAIGLGLAALVLRRDRAAAAGPGAPPATRTPAG